MTIEDVLNVVTPFWVVAATALVLFMTPGVAFFYGGMSKMNSAVNMMLMSFVAIATAAVVWVLWGYSMIGGEGFLEMFGNPFAHFGLSGLTESAELVDVGFGSTFAIITVALISGAIADRAKFSSWILFTVLWVTLVYCPMAYMVWGGGLLSADGALGSVFGEALDYAGGTVVHINAGVAALVLVLILGRRKSFGRTPEPHKPHSVPLMMVGAAILWFGWFGFNAGAATEVAEVGLIVVNTIVAPGAALLGWLLVEGLRDKRGTSVGAVSGIVSGLVAITPACANVSPLGAVAIGLIAGVLASLAVGLKYRLGYDDALDVVGVHLVAGLWGTLALGFFTLPTEELAGGLFYGGGGGQMVSQIVAAVFSILFTAVVTGVIGFAIHKTIGFRVSAEVEEAGVDFAQHNEFAYSPEHAAANGSPAGRTGGVGAAKS
jgi:Amt family ammonium transporter